MSNDVFMVKFAAFRDQLTTDNPSFPTLEALWFSTFKQSLPDNLKQNEWQGNVSAGSSNMVKTEVVNFNKDMIDNEENEIEEIKIAVRISKKNKKRYNNLHSNTKSAIINWWSRLDDATKQNIRMYLRDEVKNLKGSMAHEDLIKIISKLNTAGAGFSTQIYTPHQKIDAMLKISFLYDIVTELQSFYNWTKMGNATFGLDIYAYRFIEWGDHQRLCIIMQGGDFDLSTLYGIPAKSRSGFAMQNLKFKPNDDALRELKEIFSETKQRTMHFPDEVMWKKENIKYNTTGDPQDLKPITELVGSEDIFSQDKLIGFDYLTSFDVLVAYKIFKAFDSQIHDLELLCTDIKPGNIVGEFIYDYDNDGKYVANVNIFVIDLDSDWCYDIYWSKNATRITKSIVKPNHQLITKIFLTNQFFCWPRINKNIFCQYWVNRSHDDDNNLLMPDAMSGILCGDTSIASDWLRMIRHYQKKTQKNVQKMKDDKTACTALVRVLSRNIYFLNKLDEQTSRVAATPSPGQQQAPIGRRSPSDNKNHEADNIIGEILRWGMKMCGFRGGMRKRKRAKKKSRRKKKNKKGKRSRKGKRR